MKIPAKKKRTSGVLSDFAEGFRSLPVPAPKKGKEVTVMRNVVGSTQCRILVIGPHPTHNEMSNGVPFSDNQSDYFYSSMRDSLGFPDDDFLLMPCSYFGAKASAASTKEVLPFLVRVVPTLPRLKHIVCAGMEPFSYVFAAGRKTHARTVIGNVMEMPFLHHKPVFVLPDPSRMFPTDPDSWKDMNFANDNREAFVKLLEKLATIFPKL